MRFIYIDSQGKEVKIPTVDALALRIELGAITEATRLYDATADRWDPAGEHEIFRSLVREREDKSGGFVAPPPPTSAASAASRLAASPAPTPGPRPRNPFEALEGPAGESPVAPALPRPSAADEFMGGLDFGLTLQQPPAEPVPAPAAELSDPEPFALQPDVGAFFEAPEPEAPKEEPATFDFQGFGGMLADEDGEDEAPVSRDAPPTGHGLALEGSLASTYDFESGEQGPSTLGERMDLEQPLADSTPQPEEWNPRDRLTVDPEDEMAALNAEPARRREEDPRREERARARAAAAKPRPERKPIPALLVIGVVLVLLAGGGWFGWSKLRGGAGGAVAVEEPADPPVVLPPIAAELEPRMRELTDSAKSDWLTAIRTTLPAEHGLAAGPDREWLAGRYLADASRFAGVGAYWSALDAYLTDVEAREEDLFVAAYQARMDGAGVVGADAEAMRDRATAGFQASHPARRPIYRQLRDVIEAAAGLHSFLQANEASIEYDPAAGGSSRDPVLEAVPSTPELGREMWDQVEKITDSLDGLGALDRVTTARLLDLFQAALREVPIP